MNGTVIDIQGISVSVQSVSLEDSSDKAQTIIIRDEFKNEVSISIMFGKIISVCKK